MSMARGEVERERRQAGARQVRDTKFENQIFAINKRASREPRRRDKFQEEARLLAQSHCHSRLSIHFLSAAAAATAQRHVRQRDVLIIFCRDSCLFSSFLRLLGLATPSSGYLILVEIVASFGGTDTLTMIYIHMYSCACGESQVTT